MPAMASRARPLFHDHADDPDMSFLQDAAHPDPEVADALLGFVNDPVDPTGLDDDKLRSAKKARTGSCEDTAWFELAGGDGGLSQQPWSNVCAPLLPANEFILPLPPPPQPQASQAFVRREDARRHDAGNGCQHSVESASARERRKRISEKTSELSRLIPGGHKLNTAEMLHEAAQHVKLLQAQVGMLALMHTMEHKVTAMAQQQMHALLVSGGLLERLAAEGWCLVPRKLVDAIANDAAVKSNPLVYRDLRRFVQSLPPEQQ